MIGHDLTVNCWSVKNHVQSCPIAFGFFSVATFITKDPSCCDDIILFGRSLLFISVGEKNGDNRAAAHTVYAHTE